ncbi:MAG: response regulator transcription factor [Acidimicrobiales bacterium]|nr:response regulator transcription factor [Acidimicrobiales bacterium]
MPSLRAVVADDDLLVRAGIVAVIDALDDIELVGQAGNLSELLEVVDEQRPDVVITDVRMPPSQTDEGIQAARRIRQDHPTTGVVVLSQHAEPEYVLSVLEGGSEGVGYLLKENVSDLAEVERALRAVAAGGSSIDPAVVSVLVASRQSAPSAIDELSPREREVLSLIAEGDNNASIAARLVLSEGAVAKHINAIFSKLQLSEEPAVHRRVKAVLLWLAAAT